MSVIPGVHTGIETPIAERYLIQKFQPVAADSFNAFVDNVTGDDQGFGRGPASAPYFSIQQALKDASVSSRQEQMVIHLVNTGVPYVLPDNYVFPPIASPDSIVLDATLANGFTRLAPLVITAPPVVQQVIAAIDIVSQIPDAVSGLVPIITNLVLVPNAWLGLFIVDSATPPNVVAIRDNDATTIFADTAAALTAPFTVYARGATIAPTTPGLVTGGPTIVLQGGTAPVIFEGVNITPNTFAGAVRAAQPGAALFLACNVPSLDIGGQQLGAANPPGFVELHACAALNLSLNAGKLAVRNSVFLTGGLTSAIQKGFIATAIASSFVAPGRPLFSDNTNTAADMTLTNVEIINAAARSLLGSSNVANLTNVNITGSTQEAIELREGAQWTMATVGGSGNLSKGLRVTSGALALIASTVNVPGAAGADVTVEGLPDVSWTNLRLGSAPFGVKGPGGSAVVQVLGIDSIQPAAGILTTTTTPLAVSKAMATVLLDTTAGAKIENLPTIASCRGQKFGPFVKITADVNTATITPFAGDTIGGAASVVLSALGQNVLLQAPDVGTDWVILSALSSSGSLGSGVDIQIFTALGAGVWTKRAGAKTAVVHCIGGGGGGGSGRRGAAGSLRGGGGGGGAGSLSQDYFLAAALGATENLVVGAGGAGGAAVVVNDTDGNNGAAGVASTFGTTLLLAASGGNFGLAGTAAAGGAGGAAAAGGGSSYGAATPGGAGGAGSNGGAAGVDGTGSLLRNAPRGGGGGGGISAADAPQNGGAGGAFTSTGTLAGGTAGTVDTLLPGPGQSVALANDPGTGGGGGAASITIDAQNGETGANGGGGGGGGAAVNGRGSGAGGAGAQGLIVVITYL